MMIILKRLSVLSFSVVVFGATLSVSLSAEGSKGMTQGIVQLVESLAGSYPYTRAKIEAVTGAQLEISDENDYFVFLIGGTSELPDGTNIQLIDLRIPKRGHKHPGFITFELSGRCLTREEIEPRFGSLDLIGAPRGRTSDEQIVYAARFGGADIRFGFPEHDTKCVKVIGITPRAP
jgi:hypothetical protein